MQNALKGFSDWKVRNSNFQLATERPTDHLTITRRRVFYWWYDSTAKINYRLFNSLPSSVFQTFSTIIKGELDSSTRIMATTPKENKSQTRFLAMWKCQMTATDGFIQYMHPFLFQKNVLLHGTFGIGNKDGKRKKIPAWSETAINSVVDTHSHTFPTSKGGVFSLCVLSEHRGERAAC